MDEHIAALFPMNEREIRYQSNPYDLGDLPFRKRRAQGREVSYIPLGGGIYSEGRTPLFSIKRHARFQHFPEHCHDGIELNFLYAGNCTQVVNGRNLTLFPGQALLLSPDTIHTVAPLDEDDILLNLNINPEYLVTGILNRLHSDNMVTRLLIDSMGSSLQHSDYLLFPPDATGRLREYLEHLWTEWRSPSPVARDIVESLFVLIVSQLVLAYRETSLQTTNTPIGSALPILHYLEQHYADCTLEGTAAKFHLNPTYLSALLKEKVGLNYRELIQHLRLDAAEQLLKASDLSITEVARAVGYENVTYFYKIFQRRNGCKPGEFRKQG